MKTLEYERGVTAGQASGHWGVTIQIDDMIDELAQLEHDGEPLLSDPVVRDDLVSFVMEAKALSLSGRRMAIPALNSDYPMGLALSVKYRGTEYERRMKQYTAASRGLRVPSMSAMPTRCAAASGSARTSATLAPPLVAVPPGTSQHRCRARARPAEVRRPTCQ